MERSVFQTVLPVFLSRAMMYWRSLPSKGMMSRSKTTGEEPAPR